MRHVSIIAVFCCLFIGLSNHASAYAQPSQKTGVEISQQGRGRDQTGEEPLPKIGFVGLQDVEEKDLLKLLREPRAIGSGGSRFGESAHKAVGVLREALHAEGYLDAVVNAITDEEEKSITFFVSQGSRYNINEIRFEGSKVFSSRELASHTSRCLERFNVNGGYRAMLFDFCVRDTARFLSRRGYLQAETGEPKLRTTERALVITIPIKEGSRYKLGEIKIDGASVFNGEQVRALLSLQSGDVADAGALGKWLFEDVKDLYSAHGYVEYTAELEPDFRSAVKGEADSVVDVKVTIEEGPQFKIGSLKLIGGDSADQYLKNVMPLSAGDIYNRRLFYEGIDKLNGLGLFPPVDKDADIDFKTDEEAGLLEIIIYVDKATVKPPVQYSRNSRQPFP